jgi:hypothetical protein
MDWTSKALLPQTVREPVPRRSAYSAFCRPHTTRAKVVIEQFEVGPVAFGILWIRGAHVASLVEGPRRALCERIDFPGGSEALMNIIMLGLTATVLLIPAVRASTVYFDFTYTGAGVAPAACWRRRW